MTRLIWKRATDTLAERFVIDRGVLDADAISLYDIDGDGLMDIVSASAISPNSVYWYEQQTPHSWIRHTVDASGGTEIESAAVFEIGGKLRIFTGDQDPGIIRIYTETVLGEPTGTWTEATIVTGYEWMQNLWAYDIDDDDEMELIFCSEGTALNEGGVYWVDYTGGDATSAANWTVHEIVQHEGAFWTPHSFIDISGSGRGDLVMSARNNTGRNPATVPGVYWLARPATVTNPWTLNTIDARVADWHKVDVGNFFGGAHGKDVIALDLFSDFPIATYNFSSAYARTDITQAAGTESWQVRTIPAANGLGVNGRDAFLAAFDNSYIYKYYWTGSAWASIAIEEYVTIAHPLDGWIEWFDIDNDGLLEAVFADSSASDSKVVWLKVPSGAPITPAWSPVDKTPGGYLPNLWLRSDGAAPAGGDSLDLDDGEPVERWLDMSGHDTILTPPDDNTAPIYRTGQINGLPVVYFSGGGVLLNDDFVMDLRQRTIFIVARQRYPGTNQRIFVIAPATGDDTTSTDALAWRTGSSNGARPSVIGSTNYEVIGTDSTLVELAIWCERKGLGGTGRLYKNGGAAVASDASYTEFASASGGGLWIGGRLGSDGVLTDDRRLIGDICEILIYPVELSVADANQVGDYLERWGLTWGAIS